MKVSFNAKINSIFAIGGIFLAIKMVYSKGRSDLIEQLYFLKPQEETMVEKKTTMPKVKRKTVAK